MLWLFLWLTYTNWNIVYLLSCAFLYRSQTALHSSCSPIWPFPQLKEFESTFERASSAKKKRVNLLVWEPLKSGLYVGTSQWKQMTKIKSPPEMQDCGEQFIWVYLFACFLVQSSYLNWNIPLFAFWHCLSDSSYFIRLLLKQMLAKFSQNIAGNKLIKS